MSVGIVVTSYHTEQDLARFLLALRQSSVTGIEYQVVVGLVDADIEEADDIDRLANSIISGVDVVSFPINVGYAYACNVGVQALDPGHRTYALFNADTELRPGVLDLCDQLLWSDPLYAIVGPRQVDRDGRITHGGIFNATAPVQRGWHEQDRGQYCENDDTACTVMGSAYFIKAPVWDELTNCSIYQNLYPGVEGAFLPTKLYYEETWCSYHAREHGYKCVYAGTATMIHNWHGATKDMAYAMACFKESQKVFRAYCDAHWILHD